MPRKIYYADRLEVWSCGYPELDTEKGQFSGGSVLGVDMNYVRKVGRKRKESLDEDVTVGLERDKHFKYSSRNAFRELSDIFCELL